MSTYDAAQVALQRKITDLQAEVAALKYQLAAVRLNRAPDNAGYGPLPAFLPSFTMGGAPPFDQTHELKPFELSGSYRVHNG